MKFFKYFSWLELKEICNKLENKNCYFRHPQRDFIELLGEETVNKLVDGGCIKNSPLSDDPYDYKVPCYEFCTLFRKLYNYIVTPFGLYLRVYVFQFWRVKVWGQRMMINVFNKHYDWQEYENVDLDTL